MLEFKGAVVMLNQIDFISEYHGKVLMGFTSGRLLQIHCSYEKFSEAFGVLMNTDLATADEFFVRRHNRSFRSLVAERIEL